MKISIQRKSISGDRVQLQLSYIVNGKRRQVVVPGAIYKQGDRRGKSQAQTLAQEAAASLSAQMEGKSMCAAVRRYAETAGSKTKKVLLLRVAELWQRAGASSSPVADLAPSDIVQFVASLSKYAPNTQRSYIAQLVWVIGQEQQRGNISATKKDSLASAAQKPSAEKDNRPYIEPQDIDLLFSTPAPAGVSDLTVDAFKLSYYTGLRYSDIRQLAAENITADYIRVSMHKTGSTVTVPINPKARAILERNVRLFASLPEQTTKVNRELALWAASAGVQTTHTDGSRGSVTFHAARHSCATGLLNKGVPMEQVSALLGHKSISTTQVYAKIVNKTLSAAVALL